MLPGVASAEKPALVTTTGRCVADGTIDRAAFYSYADGEKGPFVAIFREPFPSGPMKLVGAALNEHVPFERELSIACAVPGVTPE
jgi:hypothetical protein